MDQKRASALTYVVRKSLWPEYILPALKRNAKVKQLRRLIKAKWELEKEAEMSLKDSLIFISKHASIFTNHSNEFMRWANESAQINALNEAIINAAKKAGKYPESGDFREIPNSIGSNAYLEEMRRQARQYMAKHGVGRKKLKGGFFNPFGGVWMPSKDELVDAIELQSKGAEKKEAEMSDIGLDLLRKAAGVRIKVASATQANEEEFWTKVASRVQAKLDETNISTEDFVKGASQGFLNVMGAIEKDIEKQAANDPHIKTAAAPWVSTMKRFFQGLAGQAGQANSLRDFLRGTYQGVLKNAPAQYQPLVQQAARLYKNPYVRGGAGTLAAYKLLT